MNVYRLTKLKYATDLSGNGARIAGGRWNKKGTPLLYTSETRSLATLECLLHVPLGIVPKNLIMLTLYIPDSVTTKEFHTKDLHIKWDVYPASGELSDLGTRWAFQERELLLFVPSSVVKSERNILINPLHHEIKLVSIIESENYRFDPRLLK